MSSKKKAKKRSTQTISIVVDGNELKYVADDGSDATEAHIKAHSHVTWFCADGDFVVAFKSQTPLDEKIFAQEKGKQRPRQVGGIRGTYRYNVVVFLEGGGHKFDDPQVIIN